MRKVLVFGICLAFLALCAITYVSRSSAASGVRYETYIVEKGDTLWGIAVRFAPRNMDVRDYVYRLRQVNELYASATIYPGQELLLPTR